MELLREVLERGVWSYRGPQEREFEERFAELCGAKVALTVANGSVALELGLRALGIGPGDEVVVPALTWTATAWAVVQVGATPVFADVRHDDWCLEPASFRRCIGPATRAVVPVHLYDQVAEMDDIMAISREFSLAVLEDCAHAHVARWRGRGVGTIGDLGAFSFQERKTITAGEGGAIIANSDDLADRVYALKDCGRPRRKGTVPGFGGNYRMTEFQAAVLRAQLERLPQQIELKKNRLSLLREQLESIDGVDLLPIKPEVTHGGLYAVAIRYNSEAFGKLPRSTFVDALQAEGIPLHPPYSVVYRSELWTGGGEFLGLDAPAEQLGLKASCPIAERIAESEGLFLPHSVLLGEPGDIADIVNAIRKVQKHVAELNMRGRVARLRERLASL